MANDNRVSKGRPEGGQFAPNLGGKTNLPSSPSKGQPLSPVFLGSKKVSQPIYEYRNTWDTREEKSLEYSIIKKQLGQDLFEQIVNYKLDGDSLATAMYIINKSYLDSVSYATAMYIINESYLDSVSYDGQHTYALKTLGHSPTDNSDKDIELLIGDIFHYYHPLDSISEEQVSLYAKELMQTINRAERAKKVLTGNYSILPEERIIRAQYLLLASKPKGLDIDASTPLSKVRIVNYQQILHELDEAYEAILEENSVGDYIDSPDSARDRVEILSLATRMIKFGKDSQEVEKGQAIFDRTVRLIAYLGLQEVTKKALAESNKALQEGILKYTL
jgi:hypothetical protein